MPVLVKGANTPLSSTSVPGWTAEPGVPDVDVSALLLNPAGKVRGDLDSVFCNQPVHPRGAVRHAPVHDVTVDLARLDAGIERS